MHFVFESELWPWQARTALWTFLTVPAEASADIAEVVDGFTNGFGSVRVEVTLGGSRWRTSIFPNDGGRTYVLPVKKAVRAAEAIDVGDVVTAEIELVDF